MQINVFFSRIRALKFIFAFSLLSIFTISVSAQVTTGNLQGVVTDANGALVPGAGIKLTNTETGQVRETTTNGDGVYTFVSLLPSERYKLEVNAQGFAQKTVENVVVRIGSQNSSNVLLAVAGAGASVTVTSDEAALINTDQSQLSTAYTPKQLTQLPINGGAIETFALLTPGVVTPGDADFTNGVGISANGNRGRSNNFQIDGQDNNDNSVAGPSLNITNVDAIGEVQVITNVFSAEFGRNSGAQVNAVTRNGTNAFHGTVFFYVTNSALNTRSNADKRQQGELKFLSANGQTQFTGLASRTKDPFSNGRFGGSIGGPIKKDRAFFFATYQGDRTGGEAVISGAGSGSLTWTPASANQARSLFPNAATAALVSTSVAGGPAFAQGVGQFYVVPPTYDSNGDGVVDAFSFAPGNPFGNPVTANRLSPGLFVCTVATRPCPGASLVPMYFGEGIRVVPQTNGTDQFITREDFSLTEKDNLSIRYIYDNARFPLATGRFLAGAIFDVPSKNNNLGVTYTRNISSTYTNEARFNFSRLDVQFGDTSTKPGPSIGFAGTRDLNFDLSLTFGTQNNLPQSRKVDVYQFQDTLISTFGNHNVRTGADIRLQRVTNFFLPNYLGVYTFTGANPFGAPSAASGSIPAGTPFVFDDGSDRAGFAATAFENFLLARPRQVVFALGNPLTKTKQDDYFFFVQDDWKIRSRLTLNLGLRYELSTTPFNPIIENINAREASSSPIFSPTFPLSSRTATKLPLDKNNFAPRVGFAWSPNLERFGGFFGNHQTVIRGGFGISYDPSFFNIVLNTVTAAPFAAAGTFVQTPGAAGSQSFPFLPTTTAQLSATPNTNGGDPRLFNQTRVDPNFHNPYSMGYNFGIQQELGKNSVLEVRYVGTRIIGQFQTVNGNPNVRFLNNAAQCLGLAAGTFTNGAVVGAAAASQASACANGGYNNVPLAINPVTGVNERTTGNGRLDPTQGATRLRINGASGTYNGLQTRFDTRFSDLVFNANYTWSKTLDNASEIFSTAGGGQGVADPQQFFNRTGGERGLSAFHQKHSFIANLVYELPFYKEQKGAVGKLLGGYQVSGIVRLGSGRPYTPLNVFATYDPAFENAFFGIGALRPFNGNTSLPDGTIAFSYGAACNYLFGGPECDYNGGTATPGTFIVYNTLSPGSAGKVVPNASAAMQQARLIYNDFGLVNQFGGSLAGLEAFQFFKTPFGDIGRNTLSGLPFYGVNLALFKTTNISEKYKLEFRVEAQNLLNRRNFGVPDAITEDASFGSFVGSFQNPGFNAGSVRQLRFGLRFLF